MTDEQRQRILQQLYLLGKAAGFSVEMSGELPVSRAWFTIHQTPRGVEKTITSSSLGWEFADAPLILLLRDIRDYLQREVDIHQSVCKLLAELDPQ